MRYEVKAEHRRLCNIKGVPFQKVSQVWRARGSKLIQ